MRSVLGSRASIGGVLGTGRGGAAALWWLSGGVSASNAIAVYQPKGAASLAASYTNLANPGTYTAAPGVAPTFDTATGWTFNGSTQYLTTGVVPGSTATVLVRFSDAANVGAYTVIGSRTANFIMRPRETGDVRAYYLASAATGTGAGASSGVMAIAGNQGYYNGSADGSTMTTGTYANALYIGALNNTGLALQFWSGKTQAVAIYNATLSAAQVAAISAAMAAL